MATTKKLMGTTAVGGDLLAIEDVFSTYLYTGNGSTQTITNGIDLAGEGGLVWQKGRDLAYDHQLTDTERGVNKTLTTVSTASEGGRQSVSQFNADGFLVGTEGDTNANGRTYASWTFRKAPRFFDVVTYTGDGTSGREISHNLGVAPGMIVTKKVSATSNWAVYHRGVAAGGETGALLLNSTNAFVSSSAVWNNTAPTDTVFTVGNADAVNVSGQTYVAYLFAHDPLGPSGDGSDGLISCGSYTGNGSAAGPEIYLGWEPQWLLIKDTATSSWSWYIVDNMRGFSETQYTWLAADTSAAESALADRIVPTSTGFKVVTHLSPYNANGSTYIYIAIRRGPMRQPTSGTEVFDVETSTTDAYNVNAGFPVDLAIVKQRASLDNWYWASRITDRNLKSSNTGPEDDYSAYLDFDSNTEFKISSGFFGANDRVNYVLRRAPGFFDVVAYTGTGGSSTKNHNLTVAPELLIIKVRNANGSWFVYSSPTGSEYLVLNSVAAATSSGTWTTPTSSVFTAFAGVNDPNETYIAYLFATLPGVSKVGSYTGDGTTDHSNVINCGFTTGSRFVFIKRSDGSGDWNVFDTARGMAASTNDPELQLNLADPENSDYDVVNTTPSGFSVSNIGGGINLNGVNYIFLAIA